MPSNRGVQVYDGLPASDFTRMLRSDQALQDMLDRLKPSGPWYTPQDNYAKGYQLKALDVMPDLSTPDAYPIPLTKIV